MSSARRVAIVCDYCGEEHSVVGVSDVIEARRLAAADGWLRKTDALGLSDLCRNCAEVTP